MMTEQLLDVEFDEHVAMIFSRTVCSITLKDETVLMDDFRKYEMIPLLISKMNNLQFFNF